MCERGDQSSPGPAAELSVVTTVPEPGRSVRRAAPNTVGKCGGSSVHGGLVERLSRYSVHVLPVAGAQLRRSRLQRQQDVLDTGSLHGRSPQAPERASITPAMRKQYLKDLLLNNPSNSGFSRVLSSETPSDELAAQTTACALYPMEHAWMLSAVDGNYEIILEYISEDPHLLTRKDFISGFSVLHWLAKRGQDETLIKLLRYTETRGVAVNVNLRGSGGVTPLHVATMHGQYMVIKVLVGAFGANTDAMDYNGKRPWQYLKQDAPQEMKELLGTWDDEHSGGCQQNTNNNSGTHLTTCDVEDERGRDEVEDLDHTASGSWRFSSFRKLFQPFGFLKN